MIALIPITCWRPDAEMLKCRIIAEGANGPTKPDADAIIDARRRLRDPRHPAHRGRRDRQLFRMSAAPSEAIVGRSRYPEAPLPDSGPQYRASDTERRTDGISNRNAALSIGVQRVRNAKEARGLFP
jgi:glutamate dehydrogenase (NAD(P)+)